MCVFGLIEKGESDFPFFYYLKISKIQKNQGNFADECNPGLGDSYKAALIKIKRRIHHEHASVKNHQIHYKPRKCLA